MFTLRGQLDPEGGVRPHLGILITPSALLGRHHPTSTNNTGTGSNGGAGPR
jgi:hypothetical protein